MQKQIERAAGRLLTLLLAEGLRFFIKIPSV